MLALQIGLAMLAAEVLMVVGADLAHGKPPAPPKKR